jgi:cytoplasmic iron level regulating protein YaaA (DUF328/UPF0246 family)
LLGVKGKLLETALAQTRTLGSAKCLYLPAWQRFVGVVWQFLEPQTLSSQHRKQILIPNALYGLTRADDDIADFRLKFSVRLEDIGRLDHYWREAVSGQLRTLSRRALLVNLLPAEHNAVIKDVDHVAHVSFVTADGAHAAGHAAKAVKGMVARAILKDGEQILNSFSWQGWRSTKTESGWRVAAPRSSQP